MAVRRGRPARNAAPTAVSGRKRAAAPVAKAAPAKRGSDVTVYASKTPTDYHKAFARWMVTEVGYDPDSAGSLRKAFLMGVSIATVARQAFMDSDYLEEWREKTGVQKRGPKPKAEEPTAAPRTRRKPEPEPEVDEFDDDDAAEDDDLDDDDADEFEDDDDDADDDADADDDDDFDDEPEEAPSPPRRGRPAKAAAPAKRAPAKKAAPATRRTAKPAEDDDEFVF